VDALRLQTGEPIGVVSGGQKWKEERITVGMIPSLYANRFDRRFAKLVKTTELVIQDECHAASTKTAQVILRNIPGRLRFGLSATPLEYDEYRNALVVGLFGDIIDVITASELRQHGTVAIPHVFFRTVPEATPEEIAADPPPKVNWMDQESSLTYYQWAFRRGVVENPRVEEVIRKDCEFYVRHHLPVLVQVDTKAHGKRLLALLKDLGAIYLDQDDSPARRRDERAAFNTHERPILITTPIFNLGLDFPALGALIPIGGGHSKVRIPQRLGRGYQPKALGPNVFFVTDLLNHFDGKLLEHALHRLRIYSQTKIAVLYEPDTPLDLGLVAA
jgi:superfamily II DNA or RNA helicase